MTRLVRDTETRQSAHAAAAHNKYIELSIAYRENNINEKKVRARGSDGAHTHGHGD